MTRPPMSPTALAALQVAVLEAFKWVADQERTATRAANAPMFAAQKADGDRTRDVLLPDGTMLGTLSIPKGETEVQVTDPAKLLAWVREHRPDMIERRLRTGAATSVQLLDLVAEHLPGLVEEGIRDSDYTALKNQMIMTKGSVISPEGEPTMMAAIVKHDPTGKVTYRPEPGAHERVIAAYLRGDLDGIQLGRLTRLELTAGDTEASGTPPGPVITGAVITSDEPADAETGTLW